MPLPHNLFDYCSIRKSNFIEKYLVVKRKISFVYKADILLTKLIIRGVMPLAQNLQLRRQAGIEKWSRLIAEQKNSGLTIRDFCRQHDLSWHAYYYWLRKIREQIDPALPSGSAEPQTIFTELLVHDKLPASLQVATDDIVTIQLTGITISLPATSSKATIIKFITAVKLPVYFK